MGFPIKSIDCGFTYAYSKKNESFSEKYIALHPERNRKYYVHFLSYKLHGLDTGFSTLISYDDQKRIVWSEYHPMSQANFLLKRHFATVSHLRTIEKVIKETKWKTGSVEHLVDATSDDFKGFLETLKIPVGVQIPNSDYLRLSREHARKHGLRC